MEDIEQERITICVPAEWKREFIQYARKRGTNPSQIIRDFIRTTLETKDE